MSFDPKVMQSKTAEDAKRFAPIYYGQLNLEYVYRVYKTAYDAANPCAPEAVTEQEFQNYPAAQQVLELALSVDGSAFNPDQKFLYERTIKVGGRPRNNKDWFQIFVPSVNAVLDSLDKLAPGLWVCFEDVPSVRDPKYNAPKMRGVYPDQAACAAAWSKTRQEIPIPADVLALAISLRQVEPTEAGFATLVNADASLKAFGVDRLWKATDTAPVSAPPPAAPKSKK